MIVDLKANATAAHLVNRSTGQFGVANSEMLSVPDEILQQVVLILDEEEVFGLLDDFTKVSN